MKKRIMLTALCLLLVLPLAALAGEPEIPEGDFHAQQTALKKDRSWPVYTGPGSIYGQSGGGKAKAGTNDWVQVLGGSDGSYLLVQYAVNGGRLRIGWISADALQNRDSADTRSLGDSFAWRPCHATEDALLTDDPLMSQTAVARVSAGAGLTYLARMGDWAYVEYMPENASPLCAFVKLDQLEMDPVPLDSHPYFRYIADFLAQCGIEAEPTGIAHSREMDPDYSATLWFDLKGGGRFRAYYYGSEYDPLLTPLEFNCTIYDPTDEELGKYLDGALGLLAQAEAGAIDRARNWQDVERERRVVASNGLLYHEYLGEQGLRVLLEQLSRHDGRDALNSLRARLASRILGKRDNTAVDPALGCAWYDALTLKTQNDLPTPDPAVWESDPVVAAAEKLLMEQFTAQYAPYYHFPDYEPEKGVFVVALKECARQEAGNRVTLWAAMGMEQIGLYDGVDCRLISGGWYPVRLTLEDRDGAYALAEMIEPEDGDYYWPSIVTMCDGDENLAETLVQADSGIRSAEEKYLSAAGYPDAVIGK